MQVERAWCSRNHIKPSTEVSYMRGTTQVNVRWKSWSSGVHTFLEIKLAQLLYPGISKCPRPSKRVHAGPIEKGLRNPKRVHLLPKRPGPHPLERIHTPPKGSMAFTCSLYSCVKFINRYMCSLGISSFPGPNRFWGKSPQGRFWPDIYFFLWNSGSSLSVD